MNKIKIKNYLKYVYKDIIFIIFMLLLIFIKLPYYVYKPGSAIDLTDRINIEGAKNSEGSYSMNSVGVSKGNIPTLLLALIIDDWDIVKEESVVIDNMDYNTTFQIERIDYSNSQTIAILNAYNKAGKEINVTRKRSVVTYIDENAETDIKLLDEIQEVDDKEYENINDLRAYIESKNVGDKVSLKVINNDKEYTRFATVYEYESIKVLGISVINEYSYEADPQIEITSKSTEAGSSGGLMLSLAIYDGLLDKDLTNGKKIMGTGTIDEDGIVGEIGGIKYKMLGAQKSGADVFFVPKENYKEAKKVYKKYNLSFDLVMVETFNDAVEYLENQS